MKKYEGVKIEEVLQEVVNQNTKHYQSDFRYDREVFRKYASAKESQEKWFLWLSRECGTVMVRLMDAFLEKTEGFQSWCYWKGHANQIVAYAIQIEGMNDSGDVIGNLYEVDYEASVEAAIKNAIPFDTITLNFEGKNLNDAGENLSVTVSEYEYRNHVRELIDQHGSVQKKTYLPKNIPSFLRFLSAVERSIQCGKSMMML